MPVGYKSLIWSLCVVRLCPPLPLRPGQLSLLPIPCPSPGCGVEFPFKQSAVQKKKTMYLEGEIITPQCSHTCTAFWTAIQRGLFFKEWCRCKHKSFPRTKGRIAQYSIGVMHWLLHSFHLSNAPASSECNDITVCRICATGFITRTSSGLLSRCLAMP